MYVCVFICAVLVFDKASLLLCKRKKGTQSAWSSRLTVGWFAHQVISKFAEQCDLILLLFDANKTDIGDEMQEAMAALKANEDKVRVVLNKSDVSHPPLFFMKKDSKVNRAGQAWPESFLINLDVFAGSRPNFHVVLVTSSACSRPFPL